MNPQEHDAQHQRLYHQHGQLQTFVSHPQDESALRDILEQVRDKRESESRPAFFKVRVKNPKPNIKQQLAAGKKQLAEQRAAAPVRATAKSKNNALEV